jgi:catalase
MSPDSRRPPLSHASATPVTDNLNIRTPGPSMAIFQDPSAGDVQ